mgnify:CR=1 FL=1
MVVIFGLLALAGVWAAGQALGGKPSTVKVDVGVRPAAEVPQSTKIRFHSDNPIIGLGDLSEFGAWNDPCVLKVPDGYVMYLTSNRSKAADSPVEPYRAVSADGFQWRLDPSGPLLRVDGTSYIKLETPHVVEYEGQFHMYLSAVYPEGQVPTMAIVHARSSDGVTWQFSNGGKPVISATGKLADWNGYTVAEPGAVVFNDQIHLYFSAAGARPGGKPPILQTIALARSRDGTTFDRPQIVLRQSDLFPPERGYVGYSTPSPLVIEGRVHLFYDVAHHQNGRIPEWLQVALHHARSTDGIHFDQDPVVLAKQHGAPWLASEVRSPSVLLEGSVLRLWFAGHGERGEVLRQLTERRGRLFGIGYAELDLPDL